MERKKVDGGVGGFGGNLSVHTLGLSANIKRHCSNGVYVWRACVFVCVRLLHETFQEHVRDRG